VQGDLDDAVVHGGEVDPPAVAAGEVAGPAGQERLRGGPQGLVAGRVGGRAGALLAVGGAIGMGRPTRRLAQGLVQGGAYPRAVRVPGPAGGEAGEHGGVFEGDVAEGGVFDERCQSLWQARAGWGG
jgi:hypothetical protein